MIQRSYPRQSVFRTLFLFVFYNRNQNICYLCFEVENESTMAQKTDTVVKYTAIAYSLMFFVPTIFVTKGYTGSYLLGDNLTLTVITTVVMFFVLVLAQKIRVKKLTISRKLHFNQKALSLIVISISIIYLSLSTYYFINFDINYRHSGRSLSDNSLMPIFYMTALLFRALFVSRVIRFVANGQYHRVDRIISTTFVVSNILTLNSSFQGLYIIFGVIYRFFPSLYFYRMRFLSFVLALPLSMLVLYSILYIGVGNKVGVQNVHKVVQADGLWQEWIVPRMSTLQISSTHYDFGQYETLTVLKDEMLNSVANIFVLFGAPKPAITDPWSLSRYNFHKLSKSRSKRAGASPGLVATAQMNLIFALGSLLIVVFVLRKLSLLSMDKGGVVFGLFLMIFCFYPLFLNPLNLAVPLSDLNYYFTLLLFFL